MKSTTDGTEELAARIANLKAVHGSDDILSSPSPPSAPLPPRPSTTPKMPEPRPEDFSLAEPFDGDSENEFPPFVRARKENFRHEAATGATSSEDFSAAHLTPESIKDLIKKHDIVKFVEPKFDAASGPDEPFCSWKLVEKYAKLYVGKANRPRVGLEAFLVLRCLP